MSTLNIYNDRYPFYIVSDRISAANSTISLRYDTDPDNYYINDIDYANTPDRYYIAGSNYITCTNTSATWDPPTLSDYSSGIDCDLCRDYARNITFENFLLNDSCYIYTNEENAITRRKREIRDQLTIIVKSRVQEFGNVPENEKVAMQTLRDMITEAEFRKYVKYGFISVYGKSGKVYQVFRNKWHTRVFFQGELVEEICVRLKGDVPPTDNVIAFKTMIEADEESFARLGNRYNMREAA